MVNPWILYIDKLHLFGFQPRILSCQKIIHMSLIFW